MCVANVMLGGNKSSLMFRNLREQRGLAYRIGSTYPVLRDGSHIAGYLGMDSARATPDALNAARDGILEQVQTLRSGAFTDDDLERAKGYLMGNHALQHQRVRDRAFLLGRFEALGLGYQYDFRFPDKVKEVTRERLLDLLTRYLKSPSVVILSPPESGK
jgi:predicted Zn-dependent peptidase